MTPRQDIPNTTLGKLFTLDFFIVLVVMGISWGTLSAKVSGLEDHVEDSKKTQLTQSQESKKVTDELSKEVSQINRKVDVMGNNQEHFKAQIEAVDARLEKIQDILEDRY